jgi:RNA polymerase-binding protein DksA
MATKKSRSDEKNIRRVLHDERKRTQSSIAALHSEEIAFATHERTEGGAGSEGADFATELGDREIDMGLEASARQRLEAIDAAIERLDAGTYGICVECGRQIDPERLEARPWADRCIECQRKEEAAMRGAA